MRGKGSEGSDEVTLTGITPAYAGKRQAFYKSRRWEEDHPRLCGEKILVFRTHSLRMGSPPPMRGKGTDKGHSGCDRRITPAYAGKSSLCHAHRSNNWDHPRLCGEKEIVLTENNSSNGSPPPMRGKDETTIKPRFSDRITPAYAGKRK